MFSLVLYGLLQERIMTQPYGEEQLYFKNSAYLVLNNRVIAIFIAIIMINYKGESIQNQAPIPKCAAVSVSNTIATFCQYEALKYVSFPTQTLGKCGKMIPVMILGLLLSGKKYGSKDFLSAIVVTIGCVLFVLTGEISKSSKEDSIYGLLLMVGYLFSDGFTSTFQEKLFKGYKMSTYNQMLYVNLCSAIFSLITLLFSQELFPSIEFSLKYTDFMFNSLALSAAATFGQLVILITIKEYGALFFATTMTIRQVVSIIVSCFLFSHPLTWGQWMSSALVFGTLYYKDATKQPHHHPPANPEKVTVQKV
jgi:adenosine 3'-phospho 5'-phosphosulfate transporter B2